MPQVMHTLVRLMTSDWPRGGDLAASSSPLDIPVALPWRAAASASGGGGGRSGGGGPFSRWYSLRRCAAEAISAVSGGPGGGAARRLLVGVEWGHARCKRAGNGARRPCKWSALGRPGRTHSPLDFTATARQGACLAPPRRPPTPAFWRHRLSPYPGVSEALGPCGGCAVWPAERRRHGADAVRHPASMQVSTACAGDAAGWGLVHPGPPRWRLCAEQNATKPACV
jgi:hypothetical protein